MGNTEREGTLLQALTLFGRRLRDWKEGVELVETIIERAVYKYLAASALTLIQKHAPKRFAELVPELIRRDVSWGVTFPVYQFLHRKRQDLLAPYLGRQAFRGKFSTGRNRVLLSFGSGFQRWTAKQQQTFAQTLAEVLADKDQNNSALYGAFHQLENLPVLAPQTPERVDSFVGADHANLRAKHGVASVGQFGRRSGNPRHCLPR